MTKKTVEDLCELGKNIAFLDYTKNYLKLSKIGLYPGQPIIIKAIQEEEGITPKKLTDLTHRTKATIAKALQRLEQQGYIKKEIDKQDNRIIHLFLTQLGKETYQKFIAFEQEKNTLLKETISEEEIQQLYSILLKVKNSLEK